MKNNIICYFDEDGVLNLFEKDKDARKNMWRPGYFSEIPVREGIAEVMQRINKETNVIILTKVIQRIGVTKEKEEWLQKNIPSDAYTDIIYVPYDKKKSDYMYPFYPSILVDDKEENLDDCSKKGCNGLFLSDLKVSQRYENARKVEDIWKFYQKIKKIYE